MTAMPASPDDTTLAPADTGTPETPGRVTQLWRRELNHYPVTSRRMAYLAIVVLTTVVLYYALYGQYAVATSIMGLTLILPKG